MSPGSKILCSWISHQRQLFSCAQELLGPLTELQTKLLNVLDIGRLECYLRSDPTAARGRGIVRRLRGRFLRRRFTISVRPVR